MDRLAKLFADLGRFWQNLNSAQRIAALSIGLLSAGALALLVNLASQPQYTTLYSDLGPSDAQEMVEQLRSRQIPFELTHAGTAIQVPLKRVYDLRLELAAQGLPSSGPVGFEVFNDSGLGLTPFQEKVRYRRALEGELSRTISQLASVDSARVHVNIPERAVFRREQKSASAAVVVKLRSSRTLSPGEAAGIGHLIAAAVEGLESSRITLLDTKGRLLMRPGSNEEDGFAAAAFDAQHQIEKNLGSRAQTLLDAALGEGRSVVTVSAVIDRRRIEENQDQINPDETVVLSEQRTEEERSEALATTGGVPGTPANVPGAPAAPTSGAPSREAVTRETTNFEVSRTKRHTVIPMGSLQRISVAVLLDGTYTTPEAAPGAEEAGPSAPVYQPRSVEEIAQITQIVQRAVGFTEERGDQITVQNLQFRSPLDDVAAGVSLPLWRSPELFILLPSVARALAVLGGIVMLIFFVLRPALRQLAMANVITATASESQGEGAMLELPKQGELVIPISKDDAKIAANTMKQWLRE